MAEFEQLSAGRDDLSATLNAILSARHKAYRQSGLRGIAEYQRSERDSVNIAEYLEKVVNAEEVMPKHFPAFHAALGNYPEEGQFLEHRFFAVAMDVDGQPQYLLTHWVIGGGDNYVLMAQRQFYVNHTYEALQMSFASLPYEQGVLVVMEHETFTEKVTGFGSGMARKIGRKRVAEAIAETFELIKTAVK